MRMLPVISQRVPADSYFAEAFLAPGPERIGVTGDNSYQVMFGYDWLLVWDRDDLHLHLYQEQAGVRVEVTEDLPPIFNGPVPVGARRWSCAFDQSARIIVAYEDDTGTVRVTRWDPLLNEYVQNVTFAGVDPVVAIDASWSLDVPQSDVLLFYLSADRERVLCRVQRDIYAVEHEIHDFDATVILDRVVAAPIRYQVLISDSTGTPLPDMLVSDPYPYLGFDYLSGEAEVTGSGDLTVIVLTPTLPVEPLQAAATVTGSGELGDPILRYFGGDALAGQAAVTGAGAYEPAIINYQHVDELTADAQVTGSGALSDVVILYSATDALTAAASVSGGGTYGPP